MGLPGMSTLYRVARSAALVSQKEVKKLYKKGMTKKTTKKYRFEETKNAAILNGRDGMSLVRNAACSHAAPDHDLRPVHDLESPKSYLQSITWRACAQRWHGYPGAGQMYSFDVLVSISSTTGERE